MEKLPTDVMLNIVSRLPEETMIECKLVCKPWGDTLSFIKLGLIFQFGWNPATKFCYGGEQYNAIDMHVDYSYKDLVEIENNRSVELEPPLSDMVGSCNGLVCFSVKGESHFANDPVYICNPTTEEYVYLPTFDYDVAYRKNDKTSGNFICGFGYHGSKGEYKVVRIYNDHYSPNSEPGEVQVYTLGSGHGWRDIGRIDHRLSSEPGVCANGALHWIKYGRNEIVAFDLADEESRLIPSPPISSYERITLKLLGGCLCVVHTDVEGRDQFIHIWALEKKKKINSYGMKEHEFNDFWRWSKKFSIPCTKDETYIPFAVIRSNQVLMSHKKSVFCYDSETALVRKLWDDGPRWITQAIRHVNSHVSLEALKEKSMRR